jgi:hypothetical protein
MVNLQSLQCKLLELAEQAICKRAHTSTLYKIPKWWTSIQLTPEIGRPQKASWLFHYLETSPSRLSCNGLPAETIGCVRSATMFTEILQQFNSIQFNLFQNTTLKSK